MLVDRRNGLKMFGLGAAGLILSAKSGLVSQALAQESPPIPVFKLPPLGYAFEALEPHIDAMTMTIHHGKHHAAFIGNLNGLVEKYRDLATLTPAAILKNPAQIPEAVRGPVRNNLGGHWNHSFFWELMTPGGAKEPGGDLKAAIASTFGSTDTMIEKMNAAGLARFGSGWAWLVVNKDGKLDIMSTPNQDTPLETGVKAVVIGVDVWEHAYYLKYQNRRAEYLKHWWMTVNWDKAAKNFAA